MQLKEGIPEIQVGIEHQATRYPLYKPDKMSWSFDYKKAEELVFKGRKAWAPPLSDQLQNENLTESFKEGAQTILDQIERLNQRYDIFWPLIE